jgi:hypothetical protein
MPRREILKISKSDSHAPNAETDCRREPVSVTAENIAACDIHKSALCSDEENGKFTASRRRGVG